MPFKISRPNISSKSVRNLSKVQLVVIAAVLLMAAGATFYFVIRDNSPKPADRKIIYNDDDNEPVEDQLLSIPKDAKSFVCDAISSDKIASATGQKYNPGRVSIPTAKNADGQVAACAYTAATGETGDIKSIIIVSRQFDKPAKLDSAYALLTKVTDKNRKNLGNDAFYNQESSQLVAIKGNKLSTLTISRRNTDKVSEKTFQKLLDIL